MRKCKDLRNIIVKCLRQAKKQYYQKLCSSKNPKKVWKLYRSMTQTDSAFLTLRQNKRVASSKVGKANLLNDFFSSWFNHQQPPPTKSDLDKFPVNPDQCPQDILRQEDDVVKLLLTDQLSNYRPISLLSILSKVLETHMAKLIKEHLHTTNDSFVNQWGFQKGKSTTHALLSTVHQWHLYLVEHKEVYATFLDLKKLLTLYRIVYSLINCQRLVLATS